ncbi:MAG: hypothetical protein RQ745_02475 [Longimicrobiales bacterium]|nr:hypothetical protein [Longimicrobiales bacterium]
MHRSSSPARLRVINEMPRRSGARYILYWMTAFRRLSWNPALDRAIECARSSRLPLVIFEPLRLDYPQASLRHHAFAIDGMREHREALDASPVGYLPWVEPRPGAGKGLLAHLARDAAVVVTDDAPWFFFPRMLEAAGRTLDCRLEAIDGNGIYPVHHANRTFTTAASFRRHLQAVLPGILGESPDPLPDFASLVPFEGFSEPPRGEWAPADALLDADRAGLSRLDLDPEVPALRFSGGTAAARRRLDRFLSARLPRYHEGRNDPDEESGSRLSPYLHWGHISSWEILHRVTEADGWRPTRLGNRPTGRREGWWGLSPGAEAFLDQLITWRELGFNYAAREGDPGRWESLPDWARTTLMEHEADPRPHRYTLAEFEAAATHDELWNAAQRELRTEGTIHTYLRMLWGKKILEWSDTPREALEIMIQLNNRWAIDGRDPNSYSGIMWVFGRYDRGWPERPIFGKVRSMTSASTRRKVRVAVKSGTVLDE